MKIKNLKLKIYWIFVVLVCIGSIPFVAHAQQIGGLSLTISPSLLDLTANPGDILKEKFRIRNNGSNPVSLSIIVDKLDPHSRNGQVVPVVPQPNDQSTSWVSFDKTNLVALPKEWLEVPFTITIPKSAAFGYYYAFRIGPTTTNQQTTGPSTKLLGQIVLPVLLNVASKNAQAMLSLTSFTTDTFFNEYLPVNFSVTLHNTGNIHIKPSGTIFIQLGNNQTESLDMNAGGGIILPGGTRTYTVPWTNGFLVRQPVMEDGNALVDKNGKPLTYVAFNWDKLTSFRIGKYSATALIVYDNGTRDVPLEGATTFWVFPYTAIAILFGGIIVAFVVIRFLLRWYITKEIQKRQA